MNPRCLYWKHQEVLCQLRFRLLALKANIIMLDLMNKIVLEFPNVLVLNPSNLGVGSYMWSS